MTPQELKNSILQLAIQGKLVEQRPGEGTGAELYQQIQREKQKLVKAGKIKKEKPLPEIAEDEKPFEIPEGWAWVRIRDCCLDIFSGKSPVYSKIETEYRIIGQAANQQDGLDLSQIKYTNSDFWDAMDKRYFLRVDDVLLNTLGNGTLGRSGFVGNLPYPMLTDGHLFVFRTNDHNSSKYLYYYLQLKRAEIEKGANGSTNQTFLSLTSTVNWVFPLPPLAEQKRIVAKIEELLPLVERYERAWRRLEDCNRRFPGDMQKSILQLAIQGKLVEQRPGEGTGAELYQQIQREKQKLVKAGKIKKGKPLPEIAEDEKPFEIPEGWVWVRLGQIGITQTGNTPEKSHPEYIGNYIPFISPGDIQDSAIDYGNRGLSLQGKEVGRIGGPGTILQVCIGGSIGKAAIVDREVSFNQQINAITPIECDSGYLFGVIVSQYFVGTMKERAGGTATPIVNRGLWDKLLVPLPPIAEQKRIVKLMKELLPLCHRLNNIQ